MGTAQEAAAASVLIQEASLASGPVQETGPPAESPLASLSPLQESLLAACKSGDLAVVADCVQRGADINCCRGWPLRRAVRYNRAQVWQFLVSRAEVRTVRYNNTYYLYLTSNSTNLSQADVNLTNGHGLAALHTAARFGVAAAVSALLTAPGVLPNLRHVDMLSSDPTCPDVVTTCDMLVCDVIAWSPLSTPTSERPISNWHL